MDLSSSDEEEEDEVGLMANSEASDSEEEEVNSELSILQIEFDELLHDSALLSKEYKSIKGKFCLLLNTIF